jgi:lysozyme
MGQITSVSKNCVDLIKYYEAGNDVSKYLKAYLCPAGVWTIGIGTTIYPTGKRVAQGDVITVAQANAYLMNDLRNLIAAVDSYTTNDINQQQFDALVSFAYNLGSSALKGSTLLKKVNLNLKDPSIQTEFEKWVHADGKVLPGLVKRRKSEAYLYFNGSLKFDF